MKLAHQETLGQKAELEKQEKELRKKITRLEQEIEYCMVCWSDRSDSIDHSRANHYYSNEGPCPEQCSTHGCEELLQVKQVSLVENCQLK